jgi:tetratricopeptide (TPR) repeat protein
MTASNRTTRAGASGGRARYEHAVALYDRGRIVDAIAAAEALCREDRTNPNYRILLATASMAIGRVERAAELYAALCKENPRQERLWLRRGNALRALGRRDEAIEAYRACLGVREHNGEAWWSLANLKTGALNGGDIAAMRRILERLQHRTPDRVYLNYALGRALDDVADYAQSWRHYSDGARERRLGIAYDADDVSRHVDAMAALLSARFLSDRKGWGCPDPSPIFIVGLPRSGSTLIEQILASHPLVEGTAELPAVASIVTALADGREYSAALAGTPAARLEALGADYLAHARQYRATSRPRFIDKMPNNWLHLGLVHLMLPNAKIVDARRDPMASCFSAYTQHFAKGQNFSYDLTELGRFYNDYLRAMAHIDAVLPGRVYRAEHERLIGDTEAEIRKLLNYCGLPFDPACLRFHETPRAVRTPSSEQVRRPISMERLHHWRHFEEWLGPLHTALFGQPENHTSSIRI